MACPACDWKGYIESSTARDGKIVPSLAQCPKCKDIEAYALAVQYRAEIIEQAVKLARKYEEKKNATNREPAKVIPLKRKE